MQNARISSVPHTPKAKESGITGEAGGRYRNLSSSSILHKIVNWRTSNPSQPSLTIKQSNLDVLFDPLLGDFPTRDIGVQQILSPDMDIFATHKELIGSCHPCVKNVHCYVGEIRVSNPGTVVAGFDFAMFVGFDFLHCCGVGGGVVLDRDLSCHSALRS